MSRLEKKCFIGAAAFHGLLIGVVVFGAAFIPSRTPPVTTPVITLVAIPTDKPINTGGNPNASQPPAPPPPQQKPPEPEPEPPKLVQPRQEVVRPEPVKQQPTKKNVKPQKDDDDEPVVKNSTASKPLISKTVVRRTNETARLQQEARVRAAREADRQYREDVARAHAERQKLAGEIGGIIGGVGKSLSKSTVVEAIGPGAEAFANYGSLVREIYKRAVDSAQPQSDRDAESVIRIVVARNGTVRNSQVVRRTGNSLLDKAVDRAMNSVRTLPEFPSDARDSERSFNIIIAFEAKRVSA